MTNAETNDVKSEDENPYKLPSDDRLLSYWLWKNATRYPPKPWKISHKHKDSSAEKASKTHDTDADLMKELRGRSKGKSFSLTRYVHDMRMLSRWRLCVGQKRDSVIQIEQQLDLEQQKFIQIKDEYKRCALELERFVAKDHEMSMNLLYEADKQLAETTKLSQKRDDLSRRLGHTRLDVYHWEETWRTVKACQRFLLRVSTASIDEQFTDLPMSDAESFALTSPGKSSDNGASSLESLIAAFEKEADHLSKTPGKLPHELGFDDAENLLQEFRAIELQNLNALIHLESLGGPMAETVAKITDAESRVSKEIEDVIDGIKMLEVSIEAEERRAQRLEALSGKLLQRVFRALVCSEQTLQTRVLIEDAFESCVSGNEARLGPLSMCRALEARYEALSSELDTLPRQLVLSAEWDGFRQEIRHAREIEDAARKYELMQRLLAALRRLMEPNEPKRRPLMRRSKPSTKFKRSVKRQTPAPKSNTQDGRKSEFFIEPRERDELDENDDNGD